MSAILVAPCCLLEAKMMCARVRDRVCQRQVMGQQMKGLLTHFAAEQLTHTGLIYDG
jgi:hypothetical protein